MSLYDTKIDIFNAALLRLGQKDIQEGDTGAFARIYRGTFDGVVRAKMRRHKFGFCRQQSRLIKQGPDEREGFYVYNKPVDCLLIHGIVWHGCGRLREYDNRGLKIIARVDTEDLWLYHTYTAPVRDWNADFAEVIILQLMGILNKAILEDAMAAREDMARAESLLLEAIVRDKFENPPEKWIVEPGLARHVHTATRRQRLHRGYGYGT